MRTSDEWVLRSHADKTCGILLTKEDCGGEITAIRARQLALTAFSIHIQNYTFLTPQELAEQGYTYTCKEQTT